MQVLSLLWGIMAVFGMMVAFFPCLGALNWINIPFSATGLIVSVIALLTGQGTSRGGSIAGIVCCSIAIVVGALRLILGGGVL